MNTNYANTFVDAINEDAGYEYIKDRKHAIDGMTQTRDTIDDFKKHQNHIETRKTGKGNIEVFELPGSRELQVMDFGDTRIAITD